MNEQLHWNHIGNNYNAEIFDVYASDLKRKLPFYLARHAGKNKRAIDFGCGTGKSFSYLSPLFKNVLAIDISSELLEQARQRPFQNISFKQMDLSKPGKLPLVDFIFCCNVIMMPEAKKNVVMFKNMLKALTKNGSALLVLPALESILFSSWRMMDWYHREGVTPEKIPRGELDYFKGRKTDIIQGIIYIDKVATKHYLASELEILFARAGLKITTLDKVEYDWNSEFQSPPTWMKEPYPWDWLVECKRA